MSLYFTDAGELRMLKRGVQDADSFVLRLFVNNVPYNRQKKNEDFDEPGWGWYSPVTMRRLSPAVVSGAGIAYQPFEEITFSPIPPDPGVYDFYGVFIQDETGDLLCYQRAPLAPAPISAASPLFLAPVIQLKNFGNF